MSRDTWFEKEIKDMLCVIAETKNTQEVERLFEKLLTPREINDMARRLKILEMLEEGNSYGQIRSKIGVSTAIISRLSYHVGYGFRRSNGKSKRQIVEDQLKEAANTYRHSKKISYKGVPGFIPIAKR